MQPLLCCFYHSPTVHSSFDRKFLCWFLAVKDFLVHVIFHVLSVFHLKKALSAAIHLKVLFECVFTVLEVAPLVLDLTVSVHGSSCNYLFSGFNFLLLFFIYLLLGVSKAGWDANK